MTQHPTAVAILCSVFLGAGGFQDAALAQSTSDQSVASIHGPAAESLDPSPFDELVGGLFSDLSRLPAVRAATLLTVGAVGAGLAHPWDRETSRGLSASSTAGAALSAGETLGSARVQMAGALATYATGRLTANPTVRALGVDLVQAQLLTQGMTGAIKLSVGRERPDGTRHSFPSGHASTTFASATVLQRHFGWKVGAPAYALATYVATSRVHDEHHYLSDVAFGAALGIVAARAVTLDVGERRFSISPAVVAGGGGVSVTLVD